MPVILVPIAFVLAWLALFDRAGQSGVRLAFAKTLIAGFAFVVATTEALSFFGLVGFWPVTAVWLVGALSLFFYGRRRLTDSAAALISAVWTSVREFPFFPATVIGIVLLTTLAIALVSPPNTYDSLTYHLARVAHWIQNGSVAHYPTSILRQLYQPPLAEFAILHLQLLSGADRFANLVQWMSLAGCAVFASLIASDLGFGRRLEIFAAALIVTIPGAVVQASGTQNDLVAGLFVLAFFFFMRRAANGGGRADFLWAGAAIGLAVLTKGTNYLFCFPIGAYFAVVPFLRLADRSARLAFARRVALVLLIGVALNLGHFARNFTLFGSPVSTGDDDVRNKNLTVRMLGANLARNFVINFGTRSKALQAAIENSMRNVLGKELTNPDSTWLDNEFTVQFSTHEDLAGNPLHMAVVTIALLIAIFLARRGGASDIFAIIFTIALGSLLFSALLKWQIWAARLQLPLLMLGTILVGYVLSRSAGKLRKAPIAELLLAVAFALAVPFLLFADPRRVFTNDRQFVLFSEPRRIKLFKNLPDAGPVYAQAAEVIRSRMERRSAIGLSIDYNDFDYPLWEMLKNDPAVEPRILHVGVTNVSKRLRPADAPPKLVFTTRDVNVLDGVRYREIWKYDVVRVLEREE